LPKRSEIQSLHGGCSATFGLMYALVRLVLSQPTSDCGSDKRASPI
jgi:hypothetical protein